MTEDDLSQLLGHELGLTDANQDHCFWVIRELLEIAELREREIEEVDYLADLRFEALLPREPERSCAGLGVGERAD